MPRAALLIVDMVNAFDFEGGRALLRQARRIGPRIAALKQRASKAGTPVVYCNDNFGEWQTDLRELYARCTAPERPGRKLVESIAPVSDDYFILKPRHSAFYETALESLLEKLRVKRLLLCGIAGESCIHATATDAHMRHFESVVFRDATASQTALRNTVALTHLENARYAIVRESRRIRF